MASYQKYGINPLLIHILTGKEITEILANPSVSSLPGNYAHKIAQTMDEAIEPKPKNIYSLTCRNCGRKGKYDLGKIVVDPEKYRDDSSEQNSDTDKMTSNLEGFQFTGYFRCHHCNSAGEWLIPSYTKTMLQVAVMSEVLSSKVGFDGDRIAFGKLTSADGQAFSLMTDLEEHYLSILQREPENAWLWNRLGNAYYQGGRPDLAVVAYEESLKYDPGQMESHYSFGRILFEHGETEAATSQLRQMLLTAGDYHRIEPLVLRDILAGGLYILLDILDDMEKFINFLPKATDFATYRAQTDNNKEKSDYLSLLDIDLDLSDFAGIYPLAEMYMGQRQKELPMEEQTLSLPRLDANQVVRPQKKKPPKKKGKRKRHII
ncbi:tetratricopeptide repeat protein [Desulfitobacterium sp.]|uniref:tetratricopeptide repeat protein n=1 Tax=Desulfitobacterium sp. TaxID=49981 RepID=UPI002BD75D42|nr:tetratricopeptide repeat protein [Desulfitobacterium sp.]HVJ47909.1 tetratricopeptide repeat protein [Desulfitobacterium sp.]